METTYDNCDGALWAVEYITNEEGRQLNVHSNLFRYVDKDIPPDDLGYQFHILTFKDEKPESIEFVLAYIGDVQYFIDNNSRAGYNGMMVKSKTTPKRTVKKIFGKILSNYKFSDKQIRFALKQI